MRGQRVERSGLLLPVTKVGPRDGDAAVTGTALIELVDLDEEVGIGKRQRAQHDRTDNAEHRGVDADTEASVSAAATVKAGAFHSDRRAWPRSCQNCSIVSIPTCRVPFPSPAGHCRVRGERR